MASPAAAGTCIGKHVGLLNTMPDEPVAIKNRLFVAKQPALSVTRCREEQLGQECMSRLLTAATFIAMQIDIGV